MPQYNAKMTLNELVYSVIPNLNTAERLVCNTLDSLIESAENPLDVFKRTEQGGLNDQVQHLTYQVGYCHDSLLSPSFC